MRAPSSASWHLFGVLLRPRWGASAPSPVCSPPAPPSRSPAHRSCARFIDAAVAGRPSAALAVLAGAYVAVALAGQAMTVAATYWAGRLAWSAADELRARLAGHALSLDLGFGAHRPGELIERVDGDVTKLAEFLSSFAVRVVGSALTLAGMLAIVAFIDWWVALRLALFLAMAATVVARRGGGGATGRRAPGRHRRAARRGRRAAGRRGGPARQWRRAVRHARPGRSGREAVPRRRQGGRRGATNVFGQRRGAASGVANLAAGAWLYSTGTVTLGTVFLLLQYTALLRRPLELIADQLQRVQEAVAGVSRAAELLRLPLPATGGGSGRLPAGPLAVELDAVGFAYDPAGEPALRAISCGWLRPGPRCGRADRERQDDHGPAARAPGRPDQRHCQRRWGRPALGAGRGRAGQDRPGSRTCTCSRPACATTSPCSAHTRPPTPSWPARSTELGLGRWWRGLPDGLDTVLASAGTGTSAVGAARRVRPGVPARPGLVVLDEPSSRIDPVTQVQVQRAMDHLLAGRTAVVIAHRLRTLDRADQVLVLEEGRVVEHGRRPVLAIDLSTRFARLLGAERHDGHGGHGGRGGREPAGTTGRPL